MLINKRAVIAAGVITTFGTTKQKKKWIKFIFYRFFLKNRLLKMLLIINNVRIHKNCIEVFKIN